VSVQVAATKPSLTFFDPEDVRRHDVDVWTDDDEWDVRLCTHNCRHTTIMMMV
jgi:hypothetical protein